MSSDCRGSFSRPKLKTKLSGCFITIAFVLYEVIEPTTNRDTQQPANVNFYKLSSGTWLGTKTTNNAIEMHVESLDYIAKSEKSTPLPGHNF